eukprot:INCI13196.1.p1 GENE.INCI13196.1~~INCI13196.1.p1  ORF type:complete len:555 (+),score=73.94 INCI13196.1:82-1746(+)
MPTIFGRLALAAVLFCLLYVAKSEMLVVDETPCPTELPAKACLMSSGGAADRHHYNGVALPRDITVGYVQDLLQEAIKVEHGTIPLYLTTLYSINNQSSFEATTLKSVVMEEMLHMVQAANVLNAVGGHPFIDRPDFIPEYPLVLPLINVSASVTWFTKSSVQHYQILESVPPSGYNSSISAAYKHIVLTLEALCEQHGEENIFTGDPKLQVTASLPNGESANPVLSLANATWALLGVGDQGGGCPVEGEPWPEYVNISAGYLGGGLSHAARYLEVLEGRAFGPNDTVGPPTGPSIAVNWTDVRKFTPNPSVDDFLPEQCVAGGSWVLRNDTFFVAEMLSRYGRLSNSTTDTWQECANLCMAWTIDENSPLDPCAMWSWQDNATTATEEIPYHMCLLGQQWVAPDTKLVPGLVSGCQFGTVCNNSLPVHNGAARIVKQARPRIPGARYTADLLDSPSPAPPLQEACRAALVQGREFAGNYTALLVALHNVFNGQPDTLMSTLMQMYQLKSMAQALMETSDPRIPESTLGIGPPWQYIANVSDFARRGGVAFPLV